MPDRDLTPAVTNADREAALAVIIQRRIQDAYDKGCAEGAASERAECVQELSARVCDDDCFDDQCCSVRPCRRCVAYRRAAAAIRARGEGGKA